MEQLPRLTAAALARLRSRTAKSQAARHRGETLLASEVVPTFSMPTPVYIESGEGAHVTDIDGNRYLDLAMGFGVHILGHRPPAVEAAMHEQLTRGWHTVLANTRQHELAALLNEAVACADQSILANSGTEATMHGMRLARAYTGKTRVATFAGGYHGTHDYALVQDDPRSPRSNPTGKFIGQGIPGIIRDETISILPYHDDSAFELIRRQRTELAAVIIQPVQNSVPRTDNHAFLKQLRSVCTECDVLLMFDEVVTGFRLDWGGGQSYFGVTPDLASYGKIIGGGTPVGAVCGRADIMALFGRGGSRGVFSGGTFSGNPLTMAAGTATLQLLSEQREQLYPQLEARSNRLAAAVNDFCRQEKMEATLLNAGSIACLHFLKGPIESWRQAYSANRAAESAFYINLLDQGVLVPGIHVFFVSAAHSDAHINQIIQAFTSALATCRADGLL